MLSLITSDKRDLEVVLFPASAFVCKLYAISEQNGHRERVQSA